MRHARQWRCLALQRPDRDIRIGSTCPGSYVARQYTILTATRGFGAMTNVNLPAAFKTSLSYDATSAHLDLTLDDIPTPAPVSAPVESTAARAQPEIPNRNLSPNQTSPAKRSPPISTRTV